MKLPYELQCLILYRYGGLEHPTARIMKEVIEYVVSVFPPNYVSDHSCYTWARDFSRAALCTCCLMPAHHGSRWVHVPDVSPD